MQLTITTLWRIRNIFRDRLWKKYPSMASCLIITPGNSENMDSIRQAKEWSYPWTNKHERISIISKLFLLPCERLANSTWWLAIKTFLFWRWWWVIKNFIIWTAKMQILLTRSFNLHPIFSFEKMGAFATKKK